jgi:hypothetical protein
MGLVRIGPLVLDLDDIRAIVDRGHSGPSEAAPSVVEVTYRDGSTMIFEGSHAEAIRRYVLNLPDGIPLEGANDAVMGRVGRQDVAAVHRKEGN